MCIKILLLISGTSSYAEYSFHTYTPPYGGYCEISPPNGTSLHTTFTVSCYNWSTSGGGLQYKILTKSLGNIEKLLLHTSLPSANVFLSSGVEVDDYLVNVVIEVIDWVGMFTTYQLFTHVSLISFVFFIFV